MAALVGYGIVAMEAPGYGGPSPRRGCELHKRRDSLGPLIVNERRCRPIANVFKYAAVLLSLTAPRIARFWP